MNLKTTLTLFAALVLTLTGAAVAQDPTPTAESADGGQTVEAGGLRFTLSGEVGNDVTETEVEAVPIDPEALWSSAIPAHTRIDFVDYLPDDAEEITRNFGVQPAMYVFDTADFEEWQFSNDFGYATELARLQQLLGDDIDLSEELALPYLPMVNAAQVLHTREQAVEFNGGSGIVYLTAFAQAVDPILEDSVQFVFQGVTDDGSTYIAAIFPLDTGLLPDEIPDDFDYEEFVAGFDAYLDTLREDLAEQPADEIAPDFDALIELVESIEVVE